MCSSDLILSFRHSRALLPEWGRYIGTITEPNALIIAGDDELFLQYYGQRKTLYRPKDAFQLNPRQFNDFKHGLAVSLSAGIPVYITATGLFSYDPDKEFSSYIRDNYRLAFRGKKMIEDWHRGELYLERKTDEIFRIEK